jgi:hypothetical protein
VESKLSIEGLLDSGVETLNLSQRRLFAAKILMQVPFSKLRSS